DEPAEHLHAAEHGAARDERGRAPAERDGVDRRHGRRHQGENQRARREREQRQQRADRVAEPPQRDTAGHRKSVTLDLIDAPLGLEDPRVRANRRAVVGAHPSTCWPIARAVFAIWSGLKTSHATTTAASRNTASSEYRRLMRKTRPTIATTPP